MKHFLGHTQFYDSVFFFPFFFVLLILYVDRQPTLDLRRTTVIATPRNNVFRIDCPVWARFPEGWLIIILFFELNAMVRRDWGDERYTRPSSMRWNFPADNIFKTTNLTCKVQLQHSKFWNFSKFWFWNFNRHIVMFCLCQVSLKTAGGLFNQFSIILIFSHIKFHLIHTWEFSFTNLLLLF